MASDVSLETDQLDLTEEEAYAALDKQTRSLLNMSADEFLRKWRSDGFADELEGEHHSALVYLSMMAAPFDR